MTARYTLLISIGIHIGLIGLVTSLNLMSDEAPEPVQITLREVYKSPQNGSQKKLAQKFQLIPSLRSNLTTPNSQHHSVQGLESSSSWSDSHSYVGNDIDRFDGISIHKATYLKNVWTEIDQAIPDSSYLKEYGQIGTVYLKFEVDQNGYLIGDSLRAQTDNKVLKVLSTRSIRRALRSENLDLVKPEKPTEIFVRFRWSDQTDCENNSGINKNYLSFCRVSKAEKKNFSTSEKVGTYINALQYGPGFFEEVEKYQKEENRRRTKFDAFQDLKRDPDWNLGS